MTAMTHVGPEELMAWLDGELGGDEAYRVELHVAECGECAAVAAGFKRMSEQLGEWRVEEFPGRVETGVMGRAGGRGRTPLVTMTLSRMGHPKLWRWGVGLGAVAVVLLVAVVPVWYRGHLPMASYQMTDKKTLDETLRHMPRSGLTMPAPDAPASEMDTLVAPTSPPAATVRSELEERKVMKDSRVGGGGGSALVAAASPEANAPMIARAVMLAVRVEDVDRGRAAVEALLSRHHGYAAQMNAGSAEGAARTFTASLRIPAPELAGALQELRGLGKVESESQSGEEVTGQHQDLVARLKNSREEETRLQSILEQRTGRISDVLEVEQEIARVRGEIESMEAEQAGLEHRVAFASVDLTLTEEYKAEFRAPDSAGTRMRNALVEGAGNARDMVLGMVLFTEEYGPALMVWGLLLALPGVWVWRRYRRAMQVG